MKYRVEKFLKSVSLCLMAIGFASSLSFKATAQTSILAENPMIQAAIEGKYDDVRSFLLRNTDVNLSGIGGTTILIAAAKRDFVDIIEMALTEYEAFPNLKDSIGNTALFYAVDANGYDSIQMLLDHGADVNGINQQGETALHWAARDGNLEIIQMLIDAGADTQIQDRTGRNFFETAKQSRNPNLVEDLRRYGIQ